MDGEMNGADVDLLAGLRVVDQTGATRNGCGRFLGDLGADVVFVEPPGGSAARRAEPIVNGVSAPFATRNMNKRSVVLDLDSDVDRADLERLLGAADIWIASGDIGGVRTGDLDPAVVHRRLPHLVIVVLTDFGLTGPRQHWAATGLTHLALGGQLSHSGVPDRPPFPPPGDFADESSGVQAAWAALVAYWNRLETGVGDVLDISRHEATAQLIDPAFGSIGTAAAQAGGSKPAGRVAGIMYPIFDCADGHVRLVVLSPRQWHGLRSWLGEPEEFVDPKFDHAGRRFRAADRLCPLIGSLFATLTAAEIVAEGQRRGIPVAPVLTPAEVMQAEHFVGRGLFVDVEMGNGVIGRMPVGHVIVDGARAGWRYSAPPLAGVGSAAEVIEGWSTRSTDAPADQPSRRPLEVFVSSTSGSSCSAGKPAASSPIRAPM